MKELTIIGGTDYLSSFITRRLVGKGVSITAVVREKDTAGSRLPEGVTVVEGDVQDLHSLKSALAGTKNLYMILHVDGEGRGIDPRRLPGMLGQPRLLRQWSEQKR